MEYVSRSLCVPGWRAIIADQIRISHTVFAHVPQTLRLVPMACSHVKTICQHFRKFFVELSAVSKSRLLTICLQKMLFGLEMDVCVVSQVENGKDNNWHENEECEQQNEIVENDSVEALNTTLIVQWFVAVVLALAFRLPKTFELGYNAFHFGSNLNF
jgi:hypothetical protein